MSGVLAGKCWCLTPTASGVHASRTTRSRTGSGTTGVSLRPRCMLTPMAKVIRFPGGPVEPGSKSPLRGLSSFRVQVQLGTDTNSADCGRAKAIVEQSLLEAGIHVAEDEGPFIGVQLQRSPVEAEGLVDHLFFNVYVAVFGVGRPSHLDEDMGMWFWKSSGIYGLCPARSIEPTLDEGVSRSIDEFVRQWKRANPA